MDFKTTIDRIRNAIYGVEVRESIAVMGEYLEEYFLDCASKIGDAIQSAKDAAASASEAKQALSDTKEAKADAVEAIEAAETDALTSVANATTDAKTAARNASASASAAATSEKNAGTKASEAAGSASAAEASAKSAEASANKAAAAVGTDKTLSIEDVPADSKTVGDALDGKLATTSAGYVKSVSVSGNTMTITKGDGTSQNAQLAESYTLPAATADTLGGVKVGKNITNSGGTISLNDANVISALGFEPTIAPYSITYEGYYVGTKSVMSETNPLKIPLSKIYDIVAIVALDGSKTPMETEKIKVNIALKTFSYNNDYTYGWAQKNFISLKWLTETFANSTSKYEYVVEGSTTSTAWVRLNGTTIEIYSSSSTSYDIFNRERCYYVFGIDVNMQL